MKRFDEKIHCAIKEFEMRNFFIVSFGQSFLDEVSISNSLSPCFLYLKNHRCLIVEHPDIDRSIFSFPPMSPSVK